jgi:hypothetical protein
VLVVASCSCCTDQIQASPHKGSTNFKIKIRAPLQLPTREALQAAMEPLPELVKLIVCCAAAQSAQNHVCNSGGVRTKAGEPSTCAVCAGATGCDWVGQLVASLCSFLPASPACKLEALELMNASVVLQARASSVTAPTENGYSSSSSSTTASSSSAANFLADDSSGKSSLHSSSSNSSSRSVASQESDWAEVAADATEDSSFVLLLSREGLIKELAASLPAAASPEWTVDTLSNIVRQLVQRASYDARVRATLKRVIALLAPLVTFAEIAAVEQQLARAHSELIRNGDQVCDLLHLCVYCQYQQRVHTVQHQQ